MFFLYGASGHGKVILEILKSSGKDVYGIFDDGNNLPSTILEVPILGVFSEDKWNESYALIISIGNNNIRKIIVEKLDVTFGIAIHPKSQISPSVKIGKGTTLMAGSIVNASTRIGEHCIVNTNASLDHDCVIEDFVHISPGAVITGGVSIGEGTHIGAGVIVIPGVKIGKWVTIGAGAVIINNIPDYTTVVGNPGRIIKQKEKNG
ncbi:acetyltransferase [Tenacibaculum holothuriorum]|uniref:Acetyltransferase n=1 Tax=Tenacibaculum holothuriorum TaxID=1635173 RepID=A0A1Y2PCD5_9FLAO|nr:acetyltransferase [Tenacibaculum holothuriorum]OSY88144.1 acetyltransferase [Tenacibaculum holothuriorum]